MKNSIKCYCGHTTICDCGPEESKQETLEEAAENYTKDGTKHFMEKTNVQLGFIAGAKWQSERMYSEEEVIDIFFLGRDTLDKALITKDEALILIEQFKKK